MRFKFLTYKGLATTSFIISILLFLLSMLEIFSNNNTDDIAAHTSATIEARLEKLDGFIKEAEVMPPTRRRRPSRVLLLMEVLSGP